MKIRDPTSALEDPRAVWGLMCYSRNYKARENHSEYTPTMQISKSHILKSIASFNVVIKRGVEAKESCPKIYNT